MTYRPIIIAFPSGFVLTYRQPILCHCVKAERGAPWNGIDPRGVAA